MHQRGSDFFFFNFCFNLGCAVLRLQTGPADINELRELLLRNINK